jgi:glycosyltransferase involved in cell wall biosynthesis
VIRVTHIITGLAADGAEKMLHRLIAGMDRNLFQNEVISLTDRGLMASNIEACGIPVHALGITSGFNAPYALARLIRCLRMAKPQLAQTWMYHADLFGGIAAKLAGCPTVVWNIRHSALDSRVDSYRTDQIARMCARLSRLIPTRIVCCSENSRDAHLKIGYASDRMTVIPNGFDLGAFRPDARDREAIRRELAIPESAPVIGIVGRYHPAKDHDTFLLAAGQLHRERPEVKFALCGRGVDRHNAELAERIRSAGLEGACYLLGHRDDMRRVFNLLDIVTSASTGEAFPNVIAEAMACGVPCVVTDVGQSRVIVGDTGRVVPPRASGALVQAWRDTLALCLHERKRLARLARQRVEQNFALPDVIARYENLYLQLASFTSRSSVPQTVAPQPE